MSAPYKLVYYADFGYLCLHVYIHKSGSISDLYLIFHPVPEERNIFPKPDKMIDIKRLGITQFRMRVHCSTAVSSSLVPRAYDLFGQRWDRRALVSAITGCREIHDIR